MTERLDALADAGTARWRWLRRAAWITAGVLFVVRLTWAVFKDVAEGEPRVGSRLLDEITGTAWALPIIFGIARWASMLGRESRSWRASVGALLVAFPVVSALHTLAIVLTRAFLSPRLGLGAYSLDLSLARFVYEGATNLVNLTAVAGAFATAVVVDERRVRERQMAAARRALLDAELRTLRLRLEPHFLFNALNTISATMYQDVAAADAQLGHLSALLRAALQAADRPEVTLEEELALLEHYIALVQARFETRLTIRREIAPSARSCVVPSLLLQPLVENAVRHGGLETRGTAVITIRAALANDRLRLMVHDDGPGLAPGRSALDSGTGLSATVQRLALLYGSAQTLSAGSAADGFAVSIDLPARHGATRAVSARVLPHAEAIA
ncbi:MAG: histidine kinase [Gemmatimonadaceae bacterium]|jgi:signal transduction histidine kinase|nr:histidine kinase [Gemmatimonadaceae bacterium]